jgi:uracil-DNA glycosylase
MYIKSYLIDSAKKNGIATEAMQFPDCEVEPGGVNVMMINEVVPRNPDDWFYSEAPDPENRRTALGLFEGADISVKNMRDILDLGIYITAALKTPKDGYTADPATLTAQLPLLEAELALFPNLKLIMLMGDVAAKAVNTLAKEKMGTKKNVCPTGSAGRRRHWNNEEFYWDGLRLFPSYIMTGKNLLIEPFKRDPIISDIRRMTEFVKI